MAAAQREKKTGTFTGRARIAGVLDESKGGFRTKTAAKEWARERENAWRDRHRPRGKGPGRTKLAEGLLVFAKEQLPFHKGAVAKVNRINLYLRLAGLPTLKAVPCAVIQEVAETGRAGAPALKYFGIEIATTQERRVVPSLKPCRDQLAQASVASTAIRKRLADTYVADSLADLDELVKARLAEGKSASTVRHDIDVIRSFINEVRRIWNWRELRPIAKGE